MSTIETTTTSLQPPEPDYATDEAQLAAAAFLARYSGRTLDAYRHDLHPGSTDAGPPRWFRCAPRSWLPTTPPRSAPGCATAAPGSSWDGSSAARDDPQPRRPRRPRRRPQRHAPARPARRCRSPARRGPQHQPLRTLRCRPPRRRPPTPATAKSVGPGCTGRSCPASVPVTSRPVDVAQRQQRPPLPPPRHRVPRPPGRPWPDASRLHPS
jgi:hypothetical protein